jgi:hypothetical protein
MGAKKEETTKFSMFNAFLGAARDFSYVYAHGSLRDETVAIRDHLRIQIDHHLHIHESVVAVVVVIQKNPYFKSRAWMFERDKPFRKADSPSV